MLVAPSFEPRVSQGPGVSGASFLMSLVATHADPCGATVKTFAVGVSANPVVRQLISDRQATSPLSIARDAFDVSVVASMTMRPEPSTAATIHLSGGRRPR